MEIKKKTFEYILSLLNKYKYRDYCIEIRFLIFC